jgi:hypothetical protein
LLLQVQERVAELIRTLDTLLMEMQSRGIHWKSFLDQLSVINNTYTAVSHQLWLYWKLGLSVLQGTEPQQMTRSAFPASSA